jgi:hypothetical protein
VVLLDCHPVGVETGEALVEEKAEISVDTSVEESDHRIEELMLETREPELL